MERLSEKLFINQASEIQAMRRYLNLDVTEIAEYVGITPRYWRYFESCEKRPSQSILHLLDRLCDFVNRTVENFPVTQQSLPYYLSYEDFCQNISNPTAYKWQVWQRITGLLKIQKKCGGLTNNGSLPEDSQLLLSFQNFFSN